MVCDQAAIFFLLENGPAQLGFVIIAQRYYSGTLICHRSIETSGILFCTY